MNSQTTIPFIFIFDTTCTSENTIPYAAKLIWNPGLQRVEHHMFPLLRTPPRVHGHIEAHPLDILEFRLGQIKRKKRTIECGSWHIVAPLGYLVMLADAEEPEAYQRIQQHLAGTLPLHILIQDRFHIDSATSNWPAVNRLGQNHPWAQHSHLYQRRTALLHELQSIEQQITRLTQPTGKGAPELGGDPPSRNTLLSNHRT
jgi:hypothetical protein